MAFQQHLPGSAKAGDSLFGKRGNRRLFGVKKLLKRTAGGLQAGAVHQIQQVGDDHFRLSAIRHGRCQRGKPGGAVPGHGAGQDGDGITPPGTPQHFGNAVSGQAVSGHRCRLVEKRQRVAHRSLGSAGDGCDRLGLGGDGFLFADRAQMRSKRFRRHPPQVKALASRQDGDRNLADLGSGKDELHIVGRLFKRFQERVEGALRHHVNLVDDIDLEARRDRTITDPLDDLAGVIDAGMRGGVNLQNIDVSGGGDGLAGLTDPARLQRRLTIAIGTDTVQPAGQKTRGRGLAHTANAGQHKGMCQPPERERVAKRADQRFLADQLRKAFRPVFACQHTIAVGIGLAHDV